MIVAIECRGDEVLGVVTDELEEREHGKTSMLELGRLALGEDICRQLQDARGGREPTVGLDAPDEGEDLDPSEEGNGIDGGDAVGDVGRVHLARNEVVTETVGLGGDVTEDGELGHASVLELGEAIFVESLLGDAVGQAGGIPEAGRGEGADLILEGAIEGGNGLGHGRRGEGGGGAGDGGEDSELHHGC